MKRSNYKIFLEAKYLIKKRDYISAIEKLESICFDQPNDRVAKFELAKLLVKTNRLKEARNYFESLLNTKSEIYAMLELGKLEVRLGNYNEAKNYFESLLNTQNNTYAMLELGKLEVRLGNYNEAKNYFESLLNAQNNTYAMLELGKLEVRLGNYNEAKNYFEDILKIRHDVYAINELLILSIKWEKYEDALLYLEELTNYKTKNLKHLKVYFTYINYKMGNIDKIQDIEGYFANQIVDYNKEKAINHIKLHLDENSNKIKHGLFEDNLDIEKLYNESKERIKNIEPDYSAISDKYIYDTGFDVGVVNDQKTSFIKIVTVVNTKDIVTMYPIAPIPNYKNNEKEKVRKINNETNV